MCAAFGTLALLTAQFILSHGELTSWIPSGGPGLSPVFDSDGREQRRPDGEGRTLSKRSEGLTSNRHFRIGSKY